MKAPTINLYLDRYHQQKDGKCAVTLRINHNRRRRYYPTGITLTPQEYERTVNAKRRDDRERETYLRLMSFEKKALAIVNRLSVFTFDKFEELYLENRDAGERVYNAFTSYSDELRKEGRIGTAISYECARNSLESFKSDLRFADLTPSFLRRHEQWMLNGGNSITTVGIYLRSLRTIVNRVSLDRAVNPFGQGSGKYIIPTSRNNKKALTAEELRKIFCYNPNVGSTTEMARDYWLFMYLCNGMNVKDFCLLRRKNVEGDTLVFQRAKTKRSKRQAQATTVSLKDQAKAIIGKWGQPNISPDSFIFPHLNPSMSPEQQHATIQQLTKTINKYMRRIGAEIGITKELTTYSARHSFATVLKNSGASVQFISEALAHSDPKTTLNYLSSFEQDAIHKTTDALTSFLTVNG